MGQKEQSGHRESGLIALGSLLRSRREAAGLSSRQMALKIGISRTYLQRLETGEYEHPAPEILSRIVQVFDDMRLEDLWALAGVTMPADLPEFGPYLHAKHPDWPKLVIAELSDFCDFLKHKYELH